MLIAPKLLRLQTKFDVHVSKCRGGKGWRGRKGEGGVRDGKGNTPAPLAHKPQKNKIMYKFAVVGSQNARGHKGLQTTRCRFMRLQKGHARDPVKSGSTSLALCTILAVHQIYGCFSAKWKIVADKEILDLTYC